MSGAVLKVYIFSFLFFLFDSLTLGVGWEYITSS